jgi:hypothetical protein
MILYYYYYYLLLLFIIIYYYYYYYYFISLLFYFLRYKIKFDNYSNYFIFEYFCVFFLNKILNSLQLIKKITQILQSTKL